MLQDTHRALPIWHRRQPQSTSSLARSGLRWLESGMLGNERHRVYNMHTSLV